MEPLDRNACDTDDSDRMIRILTIKEKYNNEADNKEEKLNLKDVATLFKTNQGFVNLSIVRLLQSLVAGLGVGVYYFTWIVGNVGLMGVTAVFTILGLPLAFFMPMMRRKLGMKKMIMGSFVISIIGYTVDVFCEIQSSARDLIRIDHKCCDRTIYNAL